MDFKMLPLYIVGFCWGWIFLPILFLVAGATDFVNNNYVNLFAKKNLWGFKIVTFLAILAFIAPIYFLLSKMFLDSWFPGRGSVFAGSLLFGFFSFLLLPRVENMLYAKKKEHK